MTHASGADLAEVFRLESGRAVATLIRWTGDWDAAEDAVQDAFVVALDRWSVDGIPDNPGAWITTTARRKLLDRVRREAGRPGKERVAAAASKLVAPAPEDEVIAGRESLAVDDQLRLIFTCCHPTLAPEAQVALTLRTLGALTTGEIASAFLLSEQTIAQRLVRAKRKIRDAGIPYRVPNAEELPARLDAVAAVLYLVFNEGYASRNGPSLVRADLAAEAIRLARLLATLLPDPECTALLALLILQHARRAARVDDAGELVTLDAQDRAKWDVGEIEEGLALLIEPVATRGPYRLQAEIAAAHARSVATGATDWRAITVLYDELVAQRPTAIVRLNRAVAIAEWAGPGAGLDAVDEAAAGGRLDGYHLFWATRAALLARLGRPAEAGRDYRRALDLVGNDVERRHLESCLRRL